MIIRNDDVAYDTKLHEIKKFCEICDKYKVKIIQAITLIGECQQIESTMTNEEIRKMSDKLFKENIDVLEYLKSRNDFIAVHGLWHTHAPREAEIKTAKYILEGLGFNPTYFVPPFNEGCYEDEQFGLKTCKLSEDNEERLENFLTKGKPDKPIVYLHSWRFDNNWFTWEQLDQCLKRITTT